ncbi:hypothetical protein, partial [Klebsiella variicola]|uniref:hypothetical protein n=1 Tax=Klebsiella variicola TaxID=244366 RepID=UPI002731F639
MATPQPSSLPQSRYWSLPDARSTLRRRLAEEGQTYQGLKDSVRKELIAGVAHARLLQHTSAAPAATRT